MRFAVFNICGFGECVRQLEWQVRPTGHPRPGLNTMTGFSGARPDKQFHSKNITDTEWKFGCNRRVSDFHWALLCLCQSGVLLSPWWQCDGPWATEEWRWSHLKWEVCCIIIFVKISLMNTWKLNHAGTAEVLFSRLVDRYEADSANDPRWRFVRGGLVTYLQVAQEGVCFKLKPVNYSTLGYAFLCFMSFLFHFQILASFLVADQFMSLNASHLFVCPTFIGFTCAALSSSAFSVCSPHTAPPHLCTMCRVIQPFPSV